MATAVALRTDYRRPTFVGSWPRAGTPNKAVGCCRWRRFDVMNRTEAARIFGLDRQTLRDWVLRFNEFGPDRLKDN